MHTRMKIATVALATLVGGMLVPVVMAGPVAADDTCIRRCSSVEPTPEGLLAGVRSQVEEANYYETHVVACTDTDYATGVEFQGQIHWTLALQDQPDLSRGILYRQECWNPTTGQASSFLDLQFFDSAHGRESGPAGDGPVPPRAARHPSRSSTRRAPRW